MPRGKSITYIRSDSALYQSGVIDLCFEQRLAYQGNREIGETIHTMNDTKEAFRLIVIRWSKLQAELFDPSPYFYHAIANNREEEAEEVIKLHNRRGEVENYIKELKGGFGMEWMPCGESYANAVFFRACLQTKDASFSWQKPPTMSG